MKVKGYAGRKPEKASKHEVWAGVLIDTSSVEVIHGTIKPLKRPAAD